MKQDVYVVADAWDGREIKATTEMFLAIAAGHHPESVVVEQAAHRLSLPAGGGAQLVVYLGHNGLMDVSVQETPRQSPGVPPRSAVVLACASKRYFMHHLKRGGSHPLLLTTGLMAPEAYTLDAIIRSWFSGKTPSDVREAAAGAYHRFQTCGIVAARRLFSVEP